ANGLQPGFVVGNSIFVSTDSGTHWVATSAPLDLWSCVASSTEGAKLVAVASYSFPSGSGRIYVSTNSGSTWQQTSAPGARSWRSVASSADGNKLVAVDNDFFGSLICTSTNSGADWKTAAAPAHESWWSIASSADGTRLVAAGGGVQIGEFVS